MIESPHNSLLKRCRRLLAPRMRRKAGAFLLEGVRALEDALATEVELQAVLLRDGAEISRFEAVVDRAEQRGARIEWVEAKLFCELVDMVTVPDMVTVATEPTQLLHAHR